MDQVREESHWILVSEPKMLEELNECLLEGALWFLPMPKGAPIKVSDESLRKALSVTQAYFGFPQTDVPIENLYDQYSSKIPSLDSMQTPKNVLVLSAWIVLVLERPDLIGQVGPRNDELDLPFVCKVLDCLKIAHDGSAGFAQEALNKRLRELRRTHKAKDFLQRIDSQVCTALPDSCVKQSHFQSHYANEDIQADIRKQAEPIFEAASKCLISSSEANKFLQVDMEPIVNEDFRKTFRVFVSISGN